MTACGPLCGPLTGGAEPCSSRRCKAGFGPLFAPPQRTTIGAPGEAQRSGFAGERRSSGMSEFSPLWGGNEGYGACDDEEQEKALALLCAGQSHPARSAGGFRERGLTLFQNAKPAIDAVSGKTGVFPRRCGIRADAVTDLGGI